MKELGVLLNSEGATVYLEPEKLEQA